VKKLFLFSFLALLCSGCTGLSVPVDQIIPFFLIDQRNFSPGGWKDNPLPEIPTLDYLSPTPYFLANDFSFPQKSYRYGPLRFSMEERHSDAG